MNLLGWMITDCWFVYNNNSCLFTLFRLYAWSRHEKLIPADIKVISNFHNSHEDISLNALMRYRIIVVTLITAGKLIWRKFWKNLGQKTREMKSINFTDFFFWYFPFSESKISIFMENIQKRISWNWFIWFHEYFSWTF